MRLCKTCGRAKHEGLCDMATLDDGRVVHASRIKNGMVDGVRVRNKWKKENLLGRLKKS